LAEALRHEGYCCQCREKEHRCLEVEVRHGREWSDLVCDEDAEAQEEQGADQRLSKCPEP
jgi:hypothetical protein